METHEIAQYAADWRRQKKDRRTRRAALIASEFAHILTKKRPRLISIIASLALPTLAASFT